MKKLIMMLMLFCAVIAVKAQSGWLNYAGAKNYANWTTKWLQADNIFYWQGDTIKKGKLAYTELVGDSVRFMFIGSSGPISKWFYPGKSGAAGYVLPTATATTLGGIKIGSGISIASGVASVSTNYQAPIAAGTTSQYWRGDKTWQAFPTIPTTTSQLTNNSGFITGYSETDPNIYAWAKASSKPSYAYSEITGKPTIPTYTSQLTNNSGFITGFTETDPNIYTWAKASTKPSYSYSEITGTAPGADGNYYPTSLSYSSGTLTLGRSGLSSLTASLPTSLPASDVYSWAKASSKPSYTAAEVGAASAANEGKVAFNGNHSLLGYLDDTKFDIVGAVISPKTTSTATSGSTLPITSGGVYSALSGVQNITMSQATNGWVKIGALIIQWGKYYVGDPGTNTLYTITYPMSFPTFAANIQHTLEDSGTGAGAMLHETYSYNSSSCSIRVHEASGGTQNVTINWVAFGW